MDDITRHPLIVFVLSFAILWFFAWLGASLIRRREALAESAREDFGVILAATLTLLGLIIGFTFSMAISRYDLRKTYEEAEANAIGTEYLRTDYLPLGATPKRIFRQPSKARLQTNPLPSWRSWLGPQNLQSLAQSFK